MERASASTEGAALPAMPTHASPRLRAALAEAVERLRGLYGERLRRVVLYGSRARGDATKESDVDLLVVLDGFVGNHYQEIKRAGAFWSEFLTRYDLWFSVHPYTEATYRESKGPFLCNVHEEGMELWRLPEKTEA